MSNVRTLQREALCLAQVAFDLTNGGSWSAWLARAFTCAESCTGGMLSAQIASVPGISAIYPGGIVTYSDRAKIEHLAVTPETIARHGAVSAECAAEMAWGALRLYDTRLAVSVTGIAGPDGGSEEKPVGTVWFALASADGIMKLKKGRYPGGRRSVQLHAVRAALSLLIRGIVDLENI